MLASRGLAPMRSLIQRLDGVRRLFICGSASGYSRELINCAQRCKMPVVAMPVMVIPEMVLPEMRLPPPAALLPTKLLVAMD